MVREFAKYPTLAAWGQRVPTLLLRLVAGASYVLWDQAVH